MENNKTIIRPIHYLGNKSRALTDIKNIIDELDPGHGRVYDLFAGSGTVSGFLSKSRPVTSIDIQEYSRVLTSALLSSTDSLDPIVFINKCKKSSLNKKLTNIFESIIKYEKKVISNAENGDLEGLAEFLEEASLVKFNSEYEYSRSNALNRVLKKTSKDLNYNNLNNSLKTMISTYYGGIYFSFHQSIQIDVILDQAYKYNKPERDILLAALLSTVSDIVNTVGKHFAQPIRPRTASGKPKASITKQVKKDRNIDVFYKFVDWLDLYINHQASKFDHRTYRSDFREALEKIQKDTKIVYADPPYTRDHYSRFYHILETICLRDMPKITITKTKNITQLSRGLYREDRHQSPFCIKSKAEESFEFMFQKVSDHGAALVLSYSPYDKKNNEHPRVITIERLIKLGEKYFKKTKVIELNGISHNKLNSKKHLLDRESVSEILLVFQK